MAGLPGPYRPLGRPQYSLREHPPHAPLVLEKMSADAPDAHVYASFILPTAGSATASKTAAASAEAAAARRPSAAPAAASRIGATTAGPCDRVGQHGENKADESRNHGGRQRSRYEPSHRSDGGAGRDRAEQPAQRGTQDGPDDKDREQKERIENIEIGRGAGTLAGGRCGQLLAIDDADDLVDACRNPARQIPGLGTFQLRHEVAKQRIRFQLRIVL